ncbi:MAG: hypothetical protein HY331_12260 [Chloroflexi bacterium]|nr:hypothetical protein [Chloroflexota bacterium]
MSPPSVADLFRLFVPLGIGMFLVSVEVWVLNAALARLPQPELTLATFSVAASLSWFTESPIISMIQVSTAVSASPAAVAVIRRYNWLVAAALVAFAWTVATTPLYDLVVGQLLGIPPDLAGAARLPFAILASTPLIIGSRRVGQGILVKRGQSRPVASGTAIRLALLAAVLVAIVVGRPSVYGAALIATAYIGVLAVEMAYINRLARHALVRQPVVGSESGETTLAALWRLHAPIGMSSLLFTLIGPLVNATLARAPEPATAIATWAVVVATVGLLLIPLTMIQQVVIARYGDPGARRPLRQFTAALGLGATGVVFLVALSPLYQVVIGGAMGLSPALQALGRPALLIYALAPFGAAWVFYFQGREVAERRTPDLRLGTTANLLALALGLVVISAVAGEHRVAGTAAAVVVAYGVEVLVHMMRARRWERTTNGAAVGDTMGQEMGEQMKEPVA